jgi:hypothetical protein
MRDGFNYLDPDRPEAVRLSVGDARALGEAALARIGYVADDAGIITDQLIDNALCGSPSCGESGANSVPEYPWASALVVAARRPPAADGPGTIHRRSRSLDTNCPHVKFVA